VKSDRPSLVQEKEFAKNLVARNPQTLHVIESLLDQKEEAARAKFGKNRWMFWRSGRADLDELLQAAKRFGPGE
jgi:hypothetical protein